jgi:hypothetical protein
MIHDAFRSSLEPGLLGYCELIFDVMSAQGFEGDLDELRVISGAAVQHYIFEPAYNRHEEVPREFSRLALLFNNFGFFESLRYFTGWNVRDFDRVSLPDAWTLTAHELSEGRPVVTVDLRGDMEPALVVGLEQPRTLVARIRGDSGFEPVTLDLAGRGNLQHNDAFENFFAIVRPSDDDALVGPNRQRLELLRWVVAHHRSEKEFFHETRENYASGERGFARLEELSRRVADAGDDAERAYFDDHVRFTRCGREAASRVLGAWSVVLSRALDNVAIESSLNLAAARYGDVAEALGAADFADARKLETEAVEAIEATFPNLPGRFEPID